MTSIANDDVENTTADTTKEKPTKEKVHMEMGSCCNLEELHQ